MTEQRIALETAGLTAADTATNVNGWMGTSPSMITPGSVSRLKKIRYTIASDGATTGAGVFGLELGGQGFPGGPHRFILGGTGGTLATSNIQTVLAGEIDCNIAINPSSTFTAEATANADTGTVSVGIELVFE